MKRKNRLISLLLALLTISGVVSCGTEQVSDETTTSGEVTTEPVTTEDTDSRAAAKDDLPELNFEGSTLRVLSRAGDADTKIEFCVEEESGDIVEDAVWKRNLAVQERLHIKIENITTDNTRHTGPADIIRNSVLSGSDDYDVIAGAMYTSAPLVLENLFVDLSKLNYIDPEKPWWNQSFADLTQYGIGMYVITGELAMTATSGLYVTFFNSDRFTEAYPDIDIYKLVNDGDWTLDKLHELSSGLYRDLNGDSQYDQDDFYGLYVRNQATLASDAFVGGVRLSAMKKNGDKYDISLMNDRTATYAEKMKSLIYDQESTCRGEYNDATVMTKMVNGSVVFLPWMLSGINDLRDMKDSFGILPMPKLDESQAEYSTYIHNGSTVFTIPKTCKDPDRSAAFLEAACAENYRTVTPAYFETAIKVKYTRDEPSAAMLDMIVASAYLDLPFIYANNLGYVDTLRNMFIDSSNCENLASTLASLEPTVNAKLEEIFEAYATLD